MYAYWNISYDNNIIIIYNRYLSNYYFISIITLIFQQLLNEHPFHIDAILQLSDICKRGEDSAAELIERTLYAMEAQSLITLWEEKFCKQNFLHAQYSYK